MYGTKQHSMKCVSAATCCTALHSPAVHAVTECTVCFRSTQLAEHSPETCVISTEVISCSWRAAWLSSCSVCEEASSLSPSVTVSSILDAVNKAVKQQWIHFASHYLFPLSLQDIPNKDIPAWIIHGLSFWTWALNTAIVVSLVLFKVNVSNIHFKAEKKEVKTVTVVLFKCQSRSSIAALNWKSKANPFWKYSFHIHSSVHSWIMITTCRPKSFGSIKAVLQLKLKKNLKEVNMKYGALFPQHAWNFKLTNA